ncbi:MAG: RdgB/HAM1 family non-canonical purine NTP pyrophosphatase [Alphaproteobacteria bacterium]|nr:RdgB/HAM1 family non-canonical purine NTP pyrophosphatase [Alphaproteobacteria bacterium]
MQKFKEIIFASHNKGKIAEIREILSPLGIKVLSGEDIDLPEVEETGKTFEENAYIKALAAAKEKNIPCFADDSGLCVDAIGGKPGVYTARYAPNRDFNKGMDKLLDELKETNSSNRAAHFSCVIVLAYPDGNYKAFEGRVDGAIATQKSGTAGFGYDPIFIPTGFNRSFAEFDSIEKNKISHRGRALQKFINFLKDNKGSL